LRGGDYREFQVGEGAGWRGGGGGMRRGEKQGGVSD